MDTRLPKLDIEGAKLDTNGAKLDTRLPKLDTDGAKLDKTIQTFGSELVYPNALTL